MEPSKKRRNSILKKKSAEEDTTTEIKARRISFSGKKSVKEFIAGEEAETIWGTSYEESADDLKVSSSESGLVNVHVKRIQLRNRRVVCEPQKQQKRRSSSKKKVHIAENDKENLCVKPNPQPVEIVQEARSTTPSVRIEQTQSKSSVKSELAVIKSQENFPLSQETMPQKSDLVDCSSICSSTFDFINFSGQINKVITTDHSWDVSLNESELKMFKFRVPVTATEISPNSSNILCRSIMMTEDDVNIVKMIRKQKRTMNAIKEQIIDEEFNLIETKGGYAEVTDMSRANIEDIIIEKSNEIPEQIASNSMEISQIHEGKGSKRKSEITPQSIVLDCNLGDINSPLRKKAMHSLNCSSMDVTINTNGNCPQNEPNGRKTIYESIVVDESIQIHKAKPSGRPTIHFASDAVEESAIGMHTISETNALSQTIFDSKTINESTSFPNTTASCLAMGNQIDDISMELSICANEVHENRKTNCQTINLDHSLVAGQQLSYMAIESFVQKQANFKSSETIYDSCNVEEITVPTNHITRTIKKQRESIYNSTDMDEESPKSTKSLKAIDTKGLKVRHTIHTPEEIIEDEAEDIESEIVLQKTIITPINIFEDSIQGEPETKEIKKYHQTDYDPVEIKENIVPIQQPKYKGTRASIYTPTDMIEDSPNHKETKTISTIGHKVPESMLTPEDIDEDISKVLVSKNVLRRTIKIPIDIFEGSRELGTVSKPAVKNRFTIFESADIEEDATQSFILHNKINKAKESLYFSSDMIEDSPKCSQPSQTQSKRIASSVDTAEENPRNLTSKSMLQRTIKTPIDIFDESRQLNTASKSSMKNRRTIIESADIEEDSRATQSLIAGTKIKKARDSIYTPSDMIEDSPKFSQTSQTQSKRIVSSRASEARQKIFNSIDITEANPMNLTSKSILQKTIKTPIDIFDESRQLATASKPSVKYRQTIFESADIEEDSPKCSQPSQTASKRIASSVDIAEDNPTNLTSKSMLQRTIKTPIDIFEESRQLDTASKPTMKNRQTIIESADIEEDSEATQNISAHTKIKKARDSIYTPSDMIEDSPKCSQPSQTQFKRIVSSGNSEARQKIFNSVDISEENIRNLTSKSILQKTIKTPIDNFEESRQLDTAFKPSVKNRQTIFESADIEEYSEATQNIIAHTKIKKARDSIYTPSDMIEDSPKCSQPSQTASKRIASSVDIAEENPRNLTSKSILQRTIKTPIDNFEESRQLDTASKPSVKNRQTIFESADIEEESVHLQSYIPLAQINEARHSTHAPDDMIEDSSKCSKPSVAQSNLIASSIGQEARRTIFDTEDMVEDNLTSKSMLRRTIKTPIDIFEDSQELETASKPSAKNRQTILKSADIEEDSETLQSSIALSKINRPRQSIYTPTDMIEDLRNCSQPSQRHSKKKASSADHEVQFTVINPEDIVEDSARNVTPASMHQRTIKTPFDIFEESQELETASKPSIKNRQTNFESADIEEDLKPIQSYIFQTEINKAGHSIHITSNMIESSPKCTEPMEGKVSRETIFNAEDIIEDISKEFTSKSLLQRTTKRSIDMLQDSMQAETVSKTMAINNSFVIEEVSTTKVYKSSNEPVYSPSGMLEEYPKTVAHTSKCLIKQQTIFTPDDIIDDIKNIRSEKMVQNTNNIEELPQAIKQRAPSKIQVYRRVSTAPDLTAKKGLQDQIPRQIQEKVGPLAQCSSKTPKFSFAFHQATLKKRQSIHTAVDMVEDSPEHKKQIQLSKHNVGLRKTVYEPCDITTDSPKAGPIEKIHQQTINSQVDIVTDCHVATTEKSLQNNNRQTIHTPLEMMEDSPQLKRDAQEKLVELKETQTRTHENKTNIQEIDIHLEKRNDLPFRKPTKLFSEAFKSSENPYSSTKSLMDKVMQEMGYSMNFQLEFPPEATSQKLSQSKEMCSHKEFDPSTIMSDPQEEDAPKDAVPIENTMELSMSSESISNKDEQHTMHLCEDIEVKLESDTQSKTRQLSKTSLDESLIELFKNDAQTNNPEKSDYPRGIGSANLLKTDSRQQLSHEIINNKSSNQANSILTHDSSNRKLESQKRKTFEEEATSGKAITDDTMDMSILASHNSLQHNLMKSEYNQRNSQSYYNMDIQDDGDEQLIPKAPSKRQTIHFHQDLDVEDFNENQKSSLATTINHKDQDIQLQESEHKVPSAQTLLINQDLDIENVDDHQKAISEVSEPHVYNKPCRKTIHCYEDLEVGYLQQSTVASVNGQSIDRIELNKENASPQKLRRKTMHLNEDLEVDEIFARPETSLKGPLQSSKNFNRLTMHLNENIEEVEEMKKQHNTYNKQQSFQVEKQHKRQTIFMNQDLDISEIKDLKKVPPQILSEDSSRSNRRTNHLNQDLDVDHGQDIGSKIIQQRPNRITIHYNQDLHSDDQQHSAPSSSKASDKRQTILMSQELDMTIPSGEQSVLQARSLKGEQSSQKSGERTNNFQEELETEDQDNTNEQIINKPQFCPDKKRIILSLHKETEFDDEYVNRKRLLDETKKNTKENAYSINNKLESISTQTRQTIYFTNNNSLDESVQAAKDDNNINPSIAKTNHFKEQEEASTKFLSKPRHVTISDVQSLDMDESPKPTARKSSFSRTLNFDEVPTMKSETSNKKLTSVVKPRVTWQLTSADDESPVYNPSIRSKCPMTPSEVDRSLAEYLKVEAALEDQEEEIFYDAEDGTEIEKQYKRHTCHVPVNILDESGMQPLQSHSLKRQTTFSPKEMKNESLDYGQSRLAEVETNKEQGTLYKETCQNASDNRIQKQNFVGIFQKSFESNDLMQVTQMHDASNNNSKQILMEPLLRIHIDDDKLKTSVQRNRQTLFFNESIDTADVSTAWNKPSAAVQSVKELLLENTRLFSQLNQKNPDFVEKKRSTLFFAGKDDSMDVSCIDTGPTDPESTPTKNKLSRIPQLIGSAKKLESLKKSMEFIQQELPNIGCHLKNKEVYEDVEEFSKDQDTPRRLSVSIPKKLQELADSFDGIEIPKKLIPSVLNEKESPRKVVRQLQESFDTIDIPRKVLSSVRKTLQESQGRDAKELKESCVVDEIPRRTINLNPTVLQESFDTVEIPRRGTTFQRNDTLYICPNEIETTVNASHKSIFQFEEAPITISDVSTFFSQNLLPNAKQAEATYSPNNTEDLCKLNVNETQAISRSPDSEDITHNLAHFRKRYVELTCDSIALSDSRNDIEKTHLSLVNTFDDESEMVDCQPEIQVPDKMSPSVKEQRIKPNSSVCRKCKCQRLSTTPNDTTIGSFMLKQFPVYKVDLSELEELAKKPNISDVGKVWRQRMRESDSFNVSDGSRSLAMNDDDSETIEKLLEELADKRLADAQTRQQKRKEIQIENSFVYKIRRKLQSQSNWIINDLLLFNNIIVLTHSRIRTFAIVIYFTPKDPRGVEVMFNDIQLKPNKLHTRQWKPFEYALHYQLLVELPFDLKQICPTSEHFFELLDHVETVTEDVLRTGKALLSLVLPSPASLIREPSGRLYIRKYFRTKTPQNGVKCSEIHIEVRNIKKLSYESIAMPPLYEFDENIQLLPVGNDFLRIFLKDPLKYMKT